MDKAYEHLLSLKGKNIDELTLVKLLRIDVDFDSEKKSVIEILTKIIEHVQNQRPYDYNFEFHNAVRDSEYVISRIKNLNEIVDLGIEHRELIRELQKLALQKVEDVR